MLSFALLILCLNIDALSYGISYGIKKIKLNFLYILSVSVLSTLIFLIPLSLSKYIYSYFNERVCEIINGIILIILGITYIIPKKDKTKTPLAKETFTFKKFLLECFAISADAFFTALLSGFSEKFFVFCIIFYFFTNFIAIFCGNYFFRKLGNKTHFNLSFLSCLIFILLGFFKIMGF